MTPKARAVGIDAMWADALAKEITGERPGPEWFTASEGAEAMNRRTGTNAQTSDSISARMRRLMAGNPPKAESKSVKMNGRNVTFWRMI